MRRAGVAIACALGLAATLPAVAAADFPYGGDAHDYSSLRLAKGETPNDYADDGNDWHFAATPEPNNEPVNHDPRELNGVRGASVVDPDPTKDTAWTVTTGRPDVAISVLDSGIRWDDHDTMVDLRRKIRLNKGELPKPNHDRTDSLTPGLTCSTFASDTYDANGDGVFNVDDYACDTRVEKSKAARGGKGVGPDDLLDPEDVIIAFSDGHDDDGNGYVDDIAGWDFLDDDNDAYDDVHYGHGTGEAKDSSAEANNGHQSGSCPNCMVVPLRVGDSFVADVNRFAAATTYSVDNGILVVQEALGTLNNSRWARQAIDYAYRHGVAIIASAADEAAQHHNFPGSLPHTIVVNSVTQYDSTVTPVPRSYLQFNGCTNFSSKVTIAIPSTSCSSNATGLGAGYAGLVYSAALNARDAGKLNAHPTCRRANGSACVLSVNEVRQLMATTVDDVNFNGSEPEPSCSPAPTPGCTDPNGALTAQVIANRPVLSPLATSHSYPARRGYDQFYGYGRMNAFRATDAAAHGALPPEVEITSPDWFGQVDPGASFLNVSAQVDNRGRAYTCKVYVAPGSYPNNALTTDSPPGDFQQVGGGPCDGSTRTGAIDGVVASISVADLKQRFPLDAGDFTGRESGSGAGQTSNGRPDVEPYGFTVRVVATAGPLTGDDRRNLYLHHDKDLLPGFPRTLPGDGASSPQLVDLDGDGRNELVFATSDGIVHAMRPDGSELDGWPVRGDQAPFAHPGSHAYASGEVDPPPGAFLASVATGDLDRDGVPEVVGADWEGKLYVWSASGRRRWTTETNPDFSGKPLSPFGNVRGGEPNRTQHGALGSPVIADLDGDGRPEIVLAGMDRHVYAWHGDTGKPVDGFPVLVVDPSKVASVDAQTHAVTFRDDIGSHYNQGAIVDTPAVGDIDGDGKPEIVVGTNEEYQASADGGLNTGIINTTLINLLAKGNVQGIGDSNGRVYAIKATGNPDPGKPANAASFLDGWPFKVARLKSELLPVVGEGVTGSPVIGKVACKGGDASPKVGLIPDGGPGYIVGADAQSCYGKDGEGHDIALAADAAAADRRDAPTIPAVGHPAFGRFGPGGGVSFLSPTTGVLRALDLAANEYQGGEDSISAWNVDTGQFLPGFPTPVNDLQFLTGPSIADIDGKDGEEAVGGSAYLDLAAVDSTGHPVSSAWPKLTSGWMVANPTIGAFGSSDRKVVVAMTRDGQLFAYRTDAPVCSPGSWPRFHHDNANSGDLERDAVLPGAVGDAHVADRAVAFTAPGDDGTCGTAAAYEVVQSDAPVTGSDVASAEHVTGAPVPVEAGGRQTVPLTDVSKRYVAIRAVDEQGNVGRTVSVEVRGGDGAGGGPGAGGGSGSGGQSGGNEGEPAPNAAPSTGSGSDDAGAPSGGAPTAPIPGLPGTTQVAGQTAQGSTPSTTAKRKAKAKARARAKRRAAKRKAAARRRAAAKKRHRN